MLDMEAIKNFSIDKSDWKKVKFGDVVFEPKETVKDPVTQGIEHVVGLEHIDSENIHLRRSSSIETSTTFRKKFSKGDVLFGRRRAYLKKAAKAEFEGICSGDITVMRAKSELLRTELLPFIVNNDKFFDFAITHSAGGLSPRVKFKDLANYEFYLPSFEEQEHLIDLLISIDNVFLHEKKELELQVQLKKSMSKDLFLGKNDASNKKKSVYGEIPEKWRVVTLSELRDSSDKHSFTGGPFGSNLKSEHYTESGVRIIQLQNIGNGEFLSDYKIFTSPEKADELRSCNIFPGELILAKMAPVGRCAIIPEIESRYVMCSDGIRLKIDESCYDKKFIYHAINTSHFLAFCESKCSGTTRSRITIADLKKVPVVIPESIEEQVQIRIKMDNMDSVIENQRLKMVKSRALYQAVTYKVF